MTNLWLKIWVGIKVSLFAVLVIYIFVFITKNSEKQVTPWFWYNTEPQTSVLWLVLYAFIGGVVATVLVRMIWVTLRQIRDLRHRQRTERLDKHMREMEAKAAMLRTKPSPESA